MYFSMHVVVPCYTFNQELELFLNMATAVLIDKFIAKATTLGA